MFYIKYILFFLIFFILHYLEGLPPIGGLSFAQLWKMPLWGLLLVYAITKLRRLSPIEKSGYMMSLQCFMNQETLINPMFSVLKASKLMTMPLFVVFFRGMAHRNAKLLERGMYYFAQFICLSSLPVLLGIVSPLHAIRSAESFVEGAVYFSGVLGSPHAAASYWCISILVLMYGLITGYFKSQASKLYNIVVMIIGFVSIFMAYTRTGWFMLVVGLVFLLKPVRMNVKHIVSFAMFLTVLCGGLTLLYENNDAFRMRMTGSNRYKGIHNTSIDTDGSGRAEFWETGLTNYWNNDVYGLLFGVGYTKVTEDNYKSTGMKVFSHNQFVDALCQHGLIGLSLLLVFFYCIYKHIARIDKRVKYRRLAMAVFWCSVIFAFFQNEMYFNFALLFAAIIVMTEREDRSIKSVKAKFQ